eukprot:scaffold20875_cov56-Isochrysis_galbana.AAC.1
MSVQIFGYMLAMPGCMHINRGNHESVDMNVRGFHEGGGFAMEVGQKYDSATFTLFQARLERGWRVGLKFTSPWQGAVSGGLKRMRTCAPRPAPT